MRAELARKYTSVLHDGSPSFGGSQTWFDGMLRVCGCTVIAAADIVRYLQGKPQENSAKRLDTDETPITFAEYEEYIRKIKRYIPMIPYRGTPGYLLPPFLNLALRGCRLSFRASWGAGRGGLVRRAARMLREDIPVPVCIGFCLHQMFQKPAYHGLKLYEKRGTGGSENYVWVKTVRNHMLVLTGIRGKWGRVSSWGQEYYIDLKELEQLSRGDLLGLFTNIIRIRRF